AARARGRKGGRRPKLSPEQQRHAVMMAESKIPITEIAKTLQCSRHTIYAALAQAHIAHAEAADERDARRASPLLTNMSPPSIHQGGNGDRSEQQLSCQSRLDHTHRIAQGAG